MSNTPAFAVGASASPFTPTRLHTTTTPLQARPRAPTRPCRITMQEKKGGMFQNPFARKKKDDSASQPAFMEPQAGDPGFVPPPPVPKGQGLVPSKPRTSKQEEAAKAEAAASAKKGAANKAGGTKTVAQKGAKKPMSTLEDAKRGFDLLREDLFKTAPTKAGVGRQDESAIMKPLPGEPGYKPAAYETVRVSELGISPFPEDANAVGKVGGIAAVKAAAVQVKAGKTAKEIKRAVLKTEKKGDDKPKVYDIPDYLKPIPEDTPRRGMTWKNYAGR